jgi:hypothetical protein
MWNPIDGKTIREFPGKVPTIEHYVISYDNKYIATKVNGKVKIWAIYTGKEIATIEKFKPMIEVGELYYVSEERLVWRYHSKVGIWDVKRNRRIEMLALYNVTLVRVSEDNKYLMILLKSLTTEDLLMKVYNFETLEEYSLN